MNWKVLLWVAAITVVVFSSCKKDEEETTEDFDKGALLVNLSGNIILPSLDQFSNDLNSLNAGATLLSQNTSAQQFEAVREAWKDAYLTWQTVKIFDFGPIRDNGFKGATGTYPIDTTDINANISSGSYVLGTASNVDAIGLPSLDYLFYRAGALDSIQSNPNCVGYIQDVVSKMVNETNTVISAWAGYESTFNSSTGTSSTSGFSEFINEFNRDFELAKTAKVGIPLGKQSLDIQMPEYLEARYSGFSFELLRESIASLQRVYNGNSFSSLTGGVGCDDYLLHLERSTLDNTIDDSFANIINKIDAFSTPFETAMETNTAACDELYLLFQQHVVHIKTDMTSAFGVLITYQDNDGD
jgi:predicted lipoprotein